jgi:hypothetical protein
VGLTARSGRSRLIEAGRSDADILPGGRAVELIEQAAMALSTGPAPVPGPEQVAPLQRARDKVLAAAQEVADPTGVADKKLIVAALEGLVAPNTIAGVLTDLVADGSLKRPRNGFYQLPGVTRARQLEFEVRG